MTQLIGRGPLTQEHTRARKSEDRTLNGTGDDDEAKLKEDVTKLITHGLLSKATSRSTSLGIGDLNDPRQAAQLERKQLRRRQDMPGFLVRDASWQRITLSLYDRHRDLPRMSGTGTGNFRSEYLRVLTHAFTDDRALLAMEACETMGAYFVNADLPAWHCKVAVESRMLGIIKSISPEGPDIRPVNIRDTRTRTLSSEVAAQKKA